MISGTCIFLTVNVNMIKSVEDPGFPMGGRAPVRGGHGPPMWALFGENVCENERIGSHRGACTGHTPLDLPMQMT